MPRYFILTGEGRLLVAVPLMEIKSILTGHRGVSLPFTDYCNPIISKDVQAKNVLDDMLQYGKQSGWKFMEMRDGNDVLKTLSSSSSFYRHVLNLSQDEDQLFSTFSRSMRRNIRKAINEGTRITISNSLKSINEFYRLNCMTRKKHGIPPQPYSFFKELYNHVISQQHGIVVLASHEGRSVAAAVYAHIGEKAVYKYSASNGKYLHLHPNELLMWRAIQWYCRNGYEKLCFGKTEPENEGLREYKLRWGTDETVIKYYKYDYERSTFVTGNSKAAKHSMRVFAKMPIPILRMIGTVLYRHVA
jgi:lipid II:glycine glycyltransferase (peptidoglycan interpeptide bridge formation enzyme)